MHRPSPPTLVAKYGGPGPRYTSYPPATEFREGFPASRLLEEVSSSTRPLSLYVHVPFCRALCWYCGCSKVVTGDRSGVAPYLDALAREARAFAEAAPRPVRQLALGGGTPTYLEDDELGRLVGALEENFPFEAGAERSIEIDPRTVDPVRLRRLRELGFDRFSLGVQDFDPRVLRGVHREQPAELTERLVAEARALGVRGLSFDLILGLPWQDRESFGRTIERTIALRPDRVCIFHYAHLPERFPAQRLLPCERMPDPPTKLRMMAEATEALGAAGYVPIGMDHFALPDDELARGLAEGTLWRNFQGYTTRSGVDLLGLGPTAISSAGRVYAQNEKDVEAWGRAVRAGEAPATRRGLVLTDEDLLRRDVIQTLLCRARLSFCEIEARHGVRFAETFAPELERLTELERDGLVRIDHEGITVTEVGRVFLRAVCRPFDTATGRGRTFSRVL